MYGVHLQYWLHSTKNVDNICNVSFQLIKNRWEVNSHSSEILAVI